MDQQKKQIDKLNNKKDELVMTLQNQLNQANRLNTEYSTNYTKSTEMHKQYLQQIESLGDKIQDLIQRDEQRAKQNERKIGNLTGDIQMKDVEITRLKMSLQQYKSELVHSNQIAGYFKTFQQAPTQQSSNVIQSQQNLEQERLIAQQRFIAQNNQQQRAQIQQVTNPFQGNMNNNNNNNNNQSVQQQQQQINNNLPPQTQLSNNYPSFPGNSPQKNVTTRSTLIIDNSPQTTVSNQSQQSPQQAYKAKVVQQPDFNSFQQQQAMNPNASTSPAKVDNNQSFNMSQQPFGPQSPQQVSLNDNSFINDNNDNSNSNNNVPPLEKQEEKSLHEATPASNTGPSATATSNNMSQKTQSQSPIKNLSQNVVQSPEPVAEPAVIDDEIQGSEVEFQHRPARAWRWDKEQSKWRGRGKGQLSIYYNKNKGLAKIIFTDEKHDKTRLLQWIDGESHANFIEEEVNSNNHPTKISKTNVEWFGSDYTMDTAHPMEGNWKLAFTDNPTAAQQFVDLFNGHIDALHGNNNNDNVPNANEVNQEVSTTAPIDDEEDNKSNDSTKPFTNSDINDIDPNKPFSFDIKNDKPKDSFTDDNPTDFGGKKTQWSFDTNNSGSGSGNANETTSSFSNINWNFGQTNDEKVQDKPAEDKPTDNNNVDNSNVDNGKVDGNNNKGNDEDNGMEITFKPIANLEEQEVDTGHENEDLMKELKFVKLYRFGKDVAGVPGWKNRASSSKICFYKSKETGKVRMIAREHETNKLRMNQNVPVPSVSRLSMKAAKIYQWMANDLSIAIEEEDESAGVSQWCVKFGSSDEAEQFKNIFEESSKGNASVTSPIKPQKPQQDQPATPQQVTSPQQTNKQENDESEKIMNTTLLFQDGNQQEQTEKVEDKMESKPEDDKYTGMTQEEIAADKIREEKRKQAEEAAKLFSGGNDANKVSWNADVFAQKTENNDATFQFSEEQRGVDLEVERQINKIGTDTSISFGVNAQDETGQGQDFSNVTTRETNDNDDNNEQDPNDTTSGWNSNFNFTVGGSEKQDDNQQESKEEAKNESNSGWNIGGGFSNVETTDGFANATWGKKDNETSGFGNFDDANKDFSFADLGQGAQAENENKAEENENNKNDNKKNDDKKNDDKNDDDDNGGEMTFKPIVKLDEVEVESGHENETNVQSFPVARVYRWGKDVSGVPGWKARASNTEIKFYQNKLSGKIRIVCRENITNKLRLNHLIDGELAKLEKKSEKQVGWSANDMTIAAEEEDETKGFCPFAAKFKNAETCDEFIERFNKFAQNNKELKI